MFSGVGVTVFAERIAKYREWSESQFVRTRRSAYTWLSCTLRRSRTLPIAKCALFFRILKTHGMRHEFGKHVPIIPSWSTVLPFLWCFSEHENVHSLFQLCLTLPARLQVYDAQKDNFAEREANHHCHSSLRRERGFFVAKCQCEQKRNETSHGVNLHTEPVAPVSKVAFWIAHTSFSQSIFFFSFPFRISVHRVSMKTSLIWVTRNIALASQWLFSCTICRCF